MAKRVTPQLLLKEEIHSAVLPVLKSAGFREQGQGIWQRPAPDGGEERLTLTDRIGTGHHCLSITQLAPVTIPLFYAPLAPFGDWPETVSVFLHRPMRAGAPGWAARLLSAILLPVLLVLWLFRLLLLFPLFLLEQKWLASPAALSGTRQKKIAKRAAALLVRQYEVKGR
ncbi:hypothetical protein [Pseudogemmobacter bohemicus]|uniref:hypothetical protein n=1 Tax=Pseudogemmobacter bohemicus TaxID=2250708 RepID=UPI000DD3DFC3|nr:hypothetical protein [Pseudogemmobacter bohemicus]